MTMFNDTANLPLPAGLAKWAENYERIWDSVPHDDQVRQALDAMVRARKVAE